MVTFVLGEGIIDLHGRELEELEIKWYAFWWKNSITDVWLLLH